MTSGSFATVSSQSGWHPSANNPIIQAGDLRHQGLWNDPSVYKTESGYVMYLTTSVREPFRPPVLPFRAVSADGLTWKLEPESPLFNTEGTPFVSAETPSVIRFEGTYHLYFTGIMPDGIVPPMAIGHAVSQDGIRWTVDSQPLLKATGSFSDWNGYLVAEPGAVVVDGNVYVYFSAVGARADGQPPQDQSIGLMTSADGHVFAPPQRVLRQSSLYPGSQGFAGYSTPTAFVLDGRVHLMYSVAHFEQGRNPEWQQVAIHHAHSPDGVTHFAQDSRPIFTNRDFSWATGEVLAPSVVLEDDRIRLWFAGHVSPGDLGPMINRGWKGREFGIGYAEARTSRLRK